MQWVDQFQLFLFDFDGILVDTEPLHYEAYYKMCLNWGVKWDWDFEEFCKYSHGLAQGIRKGLALHYPELFQREPNWDVLTNEKKRVYTELLKTHPLQLMPGVEPLLQELQKRGLMHCVVTNSSSEHVEIIRNSLPVLQKIPHWLTRDDYRLAKPAPDGYLKAIAQFAPENASIIGFEDTLKGFKALSQTSARPVLICPAYRDHVAECIAVGGHHFESFDTISSDALKI